MLYWKITFSNRVPCCTQSSFSSCSLSSPLDMHLLYELWVHVHASSWKKSRAQSLLAAGGYACSRALEKQEEKQREGQSLCAPSMGWLRSARSALHSSPAGVGSRSPADHKAAFVEPEGETAMGNECHSLCGEFQPPTTQLSYVFNSFDLEIVDDKK